MDNLFEKNKAGKYSRGHIFWQLFVIDKVFGYVVPMKTKIEVLEDVKKFAKEFGAPDAIISDTARE